MQSFQLSAKNDHLQYFYMRRTVKVSTVRMDINENDNAPI